MSDFPEMTPEELRQKFSSAPAMSVEEASKEIRSCKSDLARAQAQYRAAQAAASRAQSAQSQAQSAAAQAQGEQHRLLAAARQRANECEDQLGIQFSELSGVAEVVQSRGFVIGFVSGAVFASALWGLFKSR